MSPFELRDLPPELAAHVGPDARLEFPPQGRTADVALAVGARRVVVVKRCAHAVYLDWLRLECRALEALADSALPIPALVAYAETNTGAKPVGWLAMSYIPGRPLLGAVIAASESQRAVLFRSLGALLRRLHSMPIPPALLDEDDWVSRQIERARANLGWCDGTAAGLLELERSRPPAVPECLIHGDLALDNVLVDARGALSLIDWAGGGPGDPRYDVALALQTKPEAELTAETLGAFFAGYGSTPANEATRDWFVRLYDYF